RKIIPRWRDFLTTAALGQLGPASTETSEARLPAVLEMEAREAWVRNHTLWHALDLIGSAYVVGDSTDEEVQSAARFLESRDNGCPKIAKELANRILHPESQELEIPEALPASEEAIRGDLHSKRKRLIDEPRNAILWTD